MPDVRDHIRHSRPEAEAVTPLDLDRLGRRAQRQAATRRGAAILTVAVVVVGGAVAVDAFVGPGGVRIGPGDVAGTTEGREAPDSDAADRHPTPPRTVDEAITRLIQANGRATPRPTPAEGEILVERTYAIWSGQATWYERRVDHQDRTEVVRVPLASVASSADLAALREEALRAFEAGLPETEAVEYRGSPATGAITALDEAETDSHGSAEPEPGATERSEQAHAYMRAADALRQGLQPVDRIRAMEAIGRLDASIVEYRGTQRDLLGREGIAIAGRDRGVAGGVQWNVLIFDPQTGDLLGEYTEVVPAGAEAPSAVEDYTARETLSTEASG